MYIYIYIYICEGYGLFLKVQSIKTGPAPGRLELTKGPLN